MDQIAKHGLKYDDPLAGLFDQVFDPMRGTSSREPIKGQTLEDFRQLVREANEMARLQPGWAQW